MPGYLTKLQARLSALVPAALGLFLAPAALAAGPLHPRQAVPDPVGIWTGELSVGPQTLTIVFHVEGGEDGALSATMDSPDQGAMGIPVSEVSLDEGVLILRSQAVQGGFRGTLSADGQSLEGTWTQGGVELPLTLARTDSVKAPERPQEPRPPFPYRVVDVTYSNPEADITLAGTLTLPEGEGPFPAAALISGSGPQNRDEELMGHKPFAVLADHLTRQGIAVLRYDDRGVAESEGDFAAATSRDFASDAAAAIRYLKDRREVAGDEIGLVGHSEGAVVAPMVAAESGDVAFLVLLAGTGLTGEDILYLQSALIARANGATENAIEVNRRLQERMFAALKSAPDPESARTELEGALDEAIAEATPGELAAAGIGTTPEQRARWKEAQLRSITTPWFRFFLTYDPLEALRKIDHVPVLAVNGGLDLQVPPEENLRAIEKALAEAGNDDVTTRELAGLNHLFQTAETGSPAEYARIEETMSPVLLELVSSWILDRTGR